MACFGAQEDAIATIIRLMQSALAKHPDTLFVMGSYRIGKSHPRMHLPWFLE
jgi:hypothetical protein